MVASIMAALRSLTLPYGATTGGRIVLDGVNGTIDIYDTSGQLMGTFSPDGLIFYSAQYNPARIFYYDPASNVQTIYNDDGTETPSIILDGRPDTSGVWVSESGGDFIRVTADADGIPDIQYGTVTDSVMAIPFGAVVNSYAETPDVAALDITGDIDIRVELQTSDWTPTVKRAIASKGTVGGAISWLFYLHTDGTLRFTWNQEHAIQRGDVSSSAAVTPTADGHLAVRATLDVNNGAGASEYKYYTATTIAGPWTQLGVTRTTVVTSIDETTAPVRLGDDIAYYGIEDWWGRFYKAEIYDGIGGTLVASPDFTAQAIGTLGFTDAQTREWTLHGSATITAAGGDPRSYPRGLVGIGTESSDITLSTTAGVWSTYVGVSDVAVKAGRRYKCTLAGGHSFVTGGSGFTVGDFWEFTIERDVNNSGVYNQLPGIPTWIRIRANVAIAARFPLPVLVGYYHPSADAVIDFRGRATKGGGAATVTTTLQTLSGDAPFHLSIEDIGGVPTA